jgi:hypothetical protein
MLNILEFSSRIYNGPNNPADPANDQAIDSRRVNASAVWYEASLKVQRGEYRWRFYFIPLMRRTIGRDHENDLIVDDKSVSGIHAIATFDGKKLLLGDTLSAHGTFVNGRRLNRGEQIEVSDLDVICFGHARVRIRRITERTVTPDPTGPVTLAGDGDMKQCA